MYLLRFGFQRKGFVSNQVIAKSHCRRTLVKIAKKHFRANMPSYISLYKGDELPAGYSIQPVIPVKPLVSVYKLPSRIHSGIRIVSTSSTRRNAS